MAASGERQDAGTPCGCSVRPLWSPHDMLVTGLYETDLRGTLLRSLWPLLIFMPVIVVVRILLDRLEAKAERRRFERRHGTLEERLERAGRGMREAREILDGVEADLATRQIALDRLTAETQRWETLAQLGRSEADAVSQLLRSEVDRGGRTAFWQGVALNAAFFALGLIVQAIL